MASDRLHYPEEFVDSTGRHQIRCVCGGPWNPCPHFIPHKVEQSDLGFVRLVGERIAPQPEQMEHAWADVSSYKRRIRTLKQALAAAQNRIDDLTVKLLAAKHIQNRVNAQEYWCWQGDVEDHPKSLTCPVVMEIRDLRELLERCGEATNEKGR